MHTITFNHNVEFTTPNRTENSSTSINGSGFYITLPTLMTDTLIEEE